MPECKTINELVMWMIDNNVDSNSERQVLVHQPVMGDKEGNHHEVREIRINELGDLELVIDEIEVSYHA